MKQLYDKAIYDFNNPIQSYWEEISHFDQTRFPKLIGNHSCDVCVIGGGFTGISTAYHIAKIYGGDVRLLEAGHFGFASSGRNAGFACLPATKLSLNQLIKKFGMDETKKFFASQIEGIDLLSSIISEHNLECDKVGTGKSKPGINNVSWNANASSGTYIIQMSANNNYYSQKVQLVK